MIRSLFTLALFAVCAQFAVSQPPPPKPMYASYYVGQRNVNMYAAGWTTVKTYYTIDGSGTPPISFYLNSFYLNGTYMYQEVIGGSGIMRVEGPDSINFIIPVDAVSIDLTAGAQPAWTKDATMTTVADPTKTTYNPAAGMAYFGDKLQNCTVTYATYTGVKAE